MIAQQVAKKYSTALFLSAGRRGLLDEAYTLFTDFKTVLKTDPALVKFLSSPKIEEEQKIDLLHRVFGERMQTLFLEFLKVLVRKRRAMYLFDVIDAFDLMVERHKGIVRATATTAVPLSGDEETRLIERLSTKSGKKIELERRIDPRLIGGMVVRVGDEMIDGSVRYGLVKLEERLNHIKVH
jgi:F-type H+-transporting ATPase subunit delta